MSPSVVHLTEGEADGLNPWPNFRNGKRRRWTSCIMTLKRKDNSKDNKTDLKIKKRHNCFADSTHVRYSLNAAQLGMLTNTKRQLVSA